MKERFQRSYLFHADSYRETPAEKIKYDMVFDLLRSKVHGRAVILDVGCGSGLFTRRLKEFGTLYGVDISEDACKQARKNGIITKTLNIDAQTILPFRSSKFDVVIALDIIEHIYEMDFWLGQIYRILKPEGTFVVATPNMRGLTFLGRMLFGDPFEAWKGTEADHIRFFYNSSLRRLLERHKFKVERMHDTTLIIPLIARLHIFKKGYGLGYELICEATK